MEAPYLRNNFFQLASKAVGSDCRVSDWISAARVPPLPAGGDGEGLNRFHHLPFTHYQAVLDPFEIPAQLVLYQNIGTDYAKNNANPLNHTCASVSLFQTGPIKKAGL